MKAFLSIAAIALLVLTGCATNDSAQTTQNAKVVDAGCGQCLLGLEGPKGCDLAVRLDGKSYFVDGIKMKDLGDAHADDGMCNTLRKAKVTGQLVNNRYQAKTFELIPVAKH